MDDDELLRYSRHILLEDIGIEGQTRILNGRALVIGAGGLGSPAAMYLACAGLGHITLVDHDTVDLTNLQRQIAHTTDSVGTPKVESAKATLLRLNPRIEVVALAVRADAALLDVLVAQSDVVLDCCDNFSTRHAVNAACVKHRKPLVSGAAIQMDGQIAVYDPRDGACPCYACVFDPMVTPPETRCATMGVFAPLVGIIGSMQAAEALKLVVDTGHSLAGRLLMLDGRSMEWTQVHMPRKTHCAVCGTSGH
ncbi:MAG: molybdopterin-synthase adenylyltransferase MoeB [Betaproteobacteria bacterium]